MNSNVGGFDRILRIVAGLFFGVFGIVQGGTWWLLSVFGAGLIVTALTGFCWVYALAGLSTRKTGSGE